MAPRFPAARPAPNTEPDRIELKDPFAARIWAEKFKVSPEQLREAIDAVGDKATDVEMHLKGSRSTTNADRVKKVGGVSGTGGEKPR